jgi:hypothetical protein
VRCAVCGVRCAVCASFPTLVPESDRVPGIWTATLPRACLEEENTVDQWRQATSVPSDRHEICLFNVVLILDVRQACLGEDEVRLALCGAPPLQLGLRPIHGDPCWVV